MIHIFVDGYRIPISTEIFHEWTPFQFFNNLKCLKIRWEINRELLRKENAMLAREIETADFFFRGDEGDGHVRTLH